MRSVISRLFTNILMLPLILAATSFPLASEAAPARALKKNMATIMLSGVGGAVIGLSTLSFYGEPGDHVSNIYAGLALGLIAGTSYVLMNSNKTTTIETEAIYLSPRTNLIAFRVDKPKAPQPLQWPVLHYEF